MFTSSVLDVLIIGSGASGLAAALFLDRLGVQNIALYTEGLQCGTSLNAGSDKQTYYKLGMYGQEPDAPAIMASDLAAGGAMHGDLALIEAATSPLTFANLVHLGVPFPHDDFGQYIGYKTDHDPKRRATSCGPYTSRDMCRAMIAEIKRRKIAVHENRIAIELLKSSDGQQVNGAIFVNTGVSSAACLEAIPAKSIIFATGGPGGMYADSVYPLQHTGGIGLALEAGAQAVNLAESQFGLASVKFRWNVSGSYMQVLPRIISIDQQGNCREFLREYFASLPEMQHAVFLKGYQWPFAAGNVPGSSLIDIFVYRETVERGRKVFLDYRTDPENFQFAQLPPEVRDYLTRSNAHQGQTPLQRLEALNAPAIKLYRDHNIDLATEPLQIAVAAQHNNGGLAVDINWQSTNLKNFYPIGEVCGTHGVTRPGGSALNSGQVGAWRATQHIAQEIQQKSWSQPDFAKQANKTLHKYQHPQLPVNAPVTSWQQERQTLQQRMSRAGAFIRSHAEASQARDEALAQFQTITQYDWRQINNATDLAETVRNRQFCLAQVLYLTSILKQVKHIGSRGGAVVLDAENGLAIHPLLPEYWRLKPENHDYRTKVMLAEIMPDATTIIKWEQCRSIPTTDGWFENVWKKFRQIKGINE